MTTDPGMRVIAVLLIVAALGFLVWAWLSDGNDRINVILKAEADRAELARREALKTALGEPTRTTRQVGKL